MKKTKIIGIIFGVILFGVCVVGITYAYIAWTSEDIKRQVSSKCFNVFYDSGTDISGNLIASDNYTGGLVASVKMNIDSSCDIDANGVLYLNTLSTTSSNLYREGFLNYQLVIDGRVTDIKGNITSSGEIAIDLGQLKGNSVATTEYVIYVWVDINLMEVTDMDSVYYGNIKAEAIQFD